MSETPHDLFASLPASVRVVLEQQDAQGLERAFAALPASEQEATRVKLFRLRQQTQHEMNQALQPVLAQFEPVLQAVAAVACGDEACRRDVEAALAQLETRGWHLRGVMHRIWAGERDADALTAGLDVQDSALVQRTLELIRTSQP